MTELKKMYFPLSETLAVIKYKIVDGFDCDNEQI